MRASALNSLKFILKQKILAETLQDVINKTLHCVTVWLIKPEVATVSKKLNLPPCNQDGREQQVVFIRGTIVAAHQSERVPSLLPGLFYSVTEDATSVQTISD